MAVTSKKEIQFLLSDYHGRIRAVVERAWDEWRAVASFMSEQGMGPVLYSRTIANFVFDAIARHAVKEFSSDPSVNIKVESQTVKFIFKGQVLGRFKKGDENKLGRNIPTLSAMMFVDSEGIFPGLPPNEIQTKLGEVLVVARHNDVRLWEYSIGAETGGEVIEFEPRNPPPDDDDEATDTDLVRPRTADTEDAEKEN